MKIALVVIGVLVLVALGVFGWAVGANNTLVTEREAVNAAWAQVDVALAAPRRFDSQSCRDRQGFRQAGTGRHQGSDGRSRGFGWRAHAVRKKSRPIRNWMALSVGCWWLWKIIRN